MEVKNLNDINPETASDEELIILCLLLSVEDLWNTEDAEGLKKITFVKRMDSIRTWAKGILGRIRGTALCENILMQVNHEMRNTMKENNLENE